MSFALNDVQMVNRQKRGEREFQVETRACADPRDKKDHGIKVLGMVSFHFAVGWGREWGWFLLFYMTSEKVAEKKRKKNSK